MPRNPCGKNLPWPAPAGQRQDAMEHRKVKG